MKNGNRKYVWPVSAMMGLAVIGVIAAIIAMTPSQASIQAQDNGSETEAMITVSPATAEPGDTVTVTGINFREGEEASFIYVSTITVGGMPIADVENAVTTSASIHEGRTTDSGLYIARHIDIDPAGTTADGEFTVDFVLPDSLPAGKHVLQVTSCWGGADDAYPEDWVLPCGRPGLGGGVNDKIAKAFVTITEPAEPDPAVITVTPSSVEPGGTITVSGSDFREGEEASFVYVSTITVGGMPIADVENAVATSASIHEGRTTDSGLYIARHIDIDPAGTTADGEFTVDFVLPDSLPDGKHVLQVTSCWGGPDDAYPEDWVAPCGTPGLGGGMNDRIAKAFVTVMAPAPPASPVLTVSPTTAEPGDTITVSATGFRVGTEASFIYASTITVGGMPIASVASVEAASGFLHEGRVTDSGNYIAQHIDIDPPDTTADGAFTADFVLPDGLSAGTHALQVTSCWGGPDDAYPEDWAGPCGMPGLGGGVNDRIAEANVTITEPAVPDPVLTVSPSKAEPGDTITVRGSGFRMGTEASFIYTSTITIGDVAIGKVASVDLASGYLHAGRTTDSGLYIAEHIDIDPANTTPDGVFIAEFVLPYNLDVGDHELKVTACWGGPDDDYPQLGADTCGTAGLGGGVNDREATATITVE